MLFFKCLICTFFFISLFTNKGFSQIPGYQGNRFFVELGASGMINYGMPTIDNYGSNFLLFGDFNDFSEEERKQKVSFRSQYSIGANYVLSRKHIIHLGYEYRPSGLSLQEKEFELDTLLPHPAYSYSIEAGERYDFFYQLHSHKANLNFMFYAKPISNLAPLGFYYFIGLSLVQTVGHLKYERVAYPYLEKARSGTNKYRVKYDYQIFEDAEERPPNAIWGEMNPSTLMIGFNAGLGFRTIIASRITLSFQIETSLFFKYIFVDSHSHLIEEYKISKEDFKQYYHDATRARVQQNELINLRIGIGCLIF